MQSSLRRSEATKEGFKPVSLVAGSWLRNEAREQLRAERAKCCTNYLDILVLIDTNDRKAVAVTRGEVPGR